MKQFFELIAREFRMFWKNSVLRLLFFGAPILYGLLLGSLYSKGKVTDLPIIVVDKDHNSTASQKLMQMMEDNEILRIAQVKVNEEDLTRDIIETEAACVVIIPEDFQRKIYTKQNPEITTIVNTSNVLTANYASGALQVVLGTYKAGVQLETLRKQGTPEAVLMSQYEPFKTTFIKKYNRTGNYMYFLWPGVLITVFQQVILLGLALSFASEYENNTFGYLLSKTKNSFALIAVKVIPYIIMSGLIWLIYGAMAKGFRMPFFVDNIGVLTLSALLFVLAVSFIGILVSIVLPSQLKATEILMVVATPAFMVSGFTWPISQMPGFIQKLAQVIPTTNFLPIFRILIIEKGPVDLIYPYLTNLGIVTLIGFILCVVALTIKKRKHLKLANTAENKL